MRKKNQFLNTFCHFVISKQNCDYADININGDKYYLNEYIAAHFLEFLWFANQYATEFKLKI